MTLVNCNRQPDRGDKARTDQVRVRLSFCRLALESTALSGRWDEGYEIAQQAISQSPAPASWCYWVPAIYHYVKRDYETARAFIEKSGLREFTLLEATRAMIYGQLNMNQEAAKALANYRRFDFKFDQRARQWFAVHQIGPKVLDHFMEGLVKAGLDNQIQPN